MTELLVIALATAGIVHTVHTSIIFEPFRVWVNRWPRNWLVRGVQCSYCFAHWVALALFLLPREVAMLFAGIWLANHSMAVYGVLIHVLPLIQTKVRR